ncbi:MAG: cyclase/dehydrase [Thioalkalivibrio sp.]|nr:MAG: cyclase/dehydrase [Thioalkalivibrio sp.]
MTPGGWLLPWLLLWVLVPEAVAEPDIDVSFDGSRLEFRLDAVVGAPPPQVDAVLHDYSRLDRVLPLVVESRSLGEVEEGVERIATRMRGCVLFVCREVDHVFDVRAIPGHWSSGITVPELSRVRRGHMAWRIEEQEGGNARSRLQLYGYLEPDFALPRLLGPALVRVWVRSELEKSVGRIEEAALALGEARAMAVEVR